jgi:hypothetical protein
MKLEFSRQIFEKYSKVKCHENIYSGSRVVPRGRADEQTDGKIDGQTERQTDKQT